MKVPTVKEYEAMQKKRRKFVCKCGERKLGYTDRVPMCCKKKMKVIAECMVVKCRGTAKVNAVCDRCQDILNKLLPPLKEG